jgi:hypothetical protein
MKPFICVTLTPSPSFPRRRESLSHSASQIASQKPKSLVDLKIFFNSSSLWIPAFAGMTVMMLHTIALAFFYNKERYYFPANSTKTEA